MFIPPVTRLVKPFGLFFLLLLWIAPALGQTQPNPSGELSLEVQPSAQLGVEYDDNIFLEPSNKESDMLWTASPGILLRAQEFKDRLEVLYIPTFVRYRDHTESDTVRHNAGVDLAKYITPHLKFELKDTYLKTEESIEPQREIFNVRRTRGTYWRNTVRPSLSYQFGPTETVSVGYDYEILENSDPDANDARKFGPLASLTYGFDIRNILTISAAQYRYDLERETGSTDIEDFDAIDTAVRYTYRFSPQSSIYTDYSLSSRDFIDDSPDYLVHTGTLGWSHALTRHTTLNLEAGYFVQDQKGSDNTGDFVFGAVLNRKMERGSVSISARSGWNEYFLEAEPRGFSTYRTVGGRFEYRLLEELISYAGGSYWESETPDGLVDSVYEGTLGLRLDFFRYYGAALEYLHLNRSSNIPEDEYTSNRVMFSISARGPFWRVY